MNIPASGKIAKLLQATACCLLFSGSACGDTIDSEAPVRGWAHLATLRGLIENRYTTQAVVEARPSGDVVRLAPGETVKIVERATLQVDNGARANLVRVRRLDGTLWWVPEHSVRK